MIVDRFAIGAVLGSAALAVYTVPFQLAQRIAIVPGSLVSALFPRMTASDAAVRDSLAVRSTQTLACVMSPLVLGGVLVLHPFLTVWVGASLADQAASIGRLLFIAYWANAFALVPFIFLQSSGRPDLPPKMHLIEIPFYLAALYGGMKTLGLLGCALAFTARTLVDYLLLSTAAGRRYPCLGLLATNFGLLVASALLCEVLSYRDPLWWAGAVLLVGATALLSWFNAPADLKDKALQPLMRRLKRT